MIALQNSTIGAPAVRHYHPLGFFFRFHRNPLAHLQDLSRTGTFVPFQVGAQKVFLVNEPEFIHDVLVTNTKKFMKGHGLQRTKRLLGDGLLTSEGERHRRQRQLMQPAFHRQQIARYAERMGLHTHNACRRWADGTVLDIPAEMSHLTMAIVADCILGANVESDVDAIRGALSDAMGAFPLAALPFFELLQHLPFPPLTRLRRARARLDETVYRIIAEHRNETTDDLLTMLLAAREDGEGSADASRGMTDTQLRDEVMTIFLAGHETTANALSWTWHLLARHPEVEARLHQEVDDFFSRRDTAGAADLRDLPYTRQVVTESMRLYPPAWIVGRRALADHELGTHLVPRDAIVVMSQFVTHHDARFYERPDAFDPSRWTQAFEASLPRFAYYPFGGGNRVCIGEHFAWMELVLLLAKMAHRFRFEATEPASVTQMRPQITLRPSRLRMRARARR